MKTLMALKACVVAAVAAIGIGARAVAETCTWTGGGADNKASTAANWSLNRAPETGDDIVLDATSTKNMSWDLTVIPASWTQTAGYTGTVTLNTVLTEGGYNALAVSGDIDLQGGIWTCPAPGQTGMQIVGAAAGGNMTVGTNAVIMVMAYAYSQRRTGYNGGDSGSSYGGLGGPADGVRPESLKPCYGSIVNPLDFGSAGSDQSLGGGGLIKLEVAGKFTVHGCISASGWSAPYAGSSGGTINITCGSIAGTKGWKNGYGGIWAQGSQKWFGDAYRSGGGGRISILLTGAESTMADYDGWLSARACGNSGLNKADGTFAENAVFFSSIGPTTFGGAGTVYVREKNCAPLDGTLYVDNYRAATLAGTRTQVSEVMPEDERTFKKIVVRGGARFSVCSGVTVSTPCLDNTGTIPGWDNNTTTVPGWIENETGGVLKLIPDAEGNAYALGNLEFTILEIDPTVKRVVFSAGATVKVTEALIATGTEDRKIVICTTVSGEQANLVFTANTDQSQMDYLHFKDIDASKGATIMPVPGHSTGENSKGILYELPEPGEQIVWTGGAGSSLWGDPGNWISEKGLQRAPLETDRVVVNTVEAGVYPTMPDYPTTYPSMTIGAGASVTMTDNAVTFTEGFACAGTFNTSKTAMLTLDGAEIAISGVPVVNLLTVTPGTTLKMAEGAKITVNDRLYAVGTDEKPISLVSAEDGGTWALVSAWPVPGYTFIDRATLVGCDASEGFTLYPQRSTASDCVNVDAERKVSYWTGAVSTDFMAAGNWRGGVAPESGSDIVIDQTQADKMPTLTTADMAFGRLVVLKGTVSFSKSVTFDDIYLWPAATGNLPTAVFNDTLTVVNDILLTNDVVFSSAKRVTVGGNVTLRAGAMMTHPSFGNNSTTRIDLEVAGDMFIDEQSVVQATGPAKVTASTPGQNGSRGGSVHGGVGNTYATYTYRDMPACYGSIYSPTEPGTVGSTSNSGSAGGVAVLNVAGTLTVDGLITASAWLAPYTGHSGGSVNITCGNLVGTGAWGTGWGGIWAQGSTQWFNAGDSRNAGGGGRISITLTGAEATLEDFAGHVSARGCGHNESIKYESDRKQPVSAFSYAFTTTAGAGTIYIREKNAAVDAGTLIIDNDATLATTDDGCVTVISATMSADERRFGKILLRKGGRLVVADGVTVETTAIENDAEAPGAFMNEETGKVKLIGDADGNAYVKGNVELTNLIIDPSVINLYVDPGSTVTVSKAFTACGTAERKITLGSTEEGKPFYLKVDASATVNLDYLHVRDCDATPGAKLAPEHSTSEGITEGWNLITIVPGTEVAWTGASSGAWNDAGNWNVERVPVATDLVTIPAGAANMPTLPTTDVTVSNLTVAAGASLTLAGAALTVTGDLTVNGALTATADESVTVGGNVAFGKAAVVAPATSVLTLANAGDIAADFGGKALYRIVFAGEGRIAVAGGFDVTTLDVSAGSAITFSELKSDLYAMTILHVDGTASDPVTLASRITGAKWNLKLRGYCRVTSAAVTDSDASQGEAVYAADSSVTDCENWITPDLRYVWTGAVSTDFADTNNWLVGGAIPDAAPTAESDVIVDAAGLANLPVAKNAAMRGLTIVSGGLTVREPSEVSASVVVLDGATLTVDKLLTVGGDVTALSGARLTHTLLPDSDNRNGESYRLELSVGGDFTIERNAVVDVTGKGYALARGPGYGNSSAAAAHGGNGFIVGEQQKNTATQKYYWSGATAAPCYGSVFAPTNAASGKYSRGGGAAVVRVGGVLTVDGTITANGALKSNDYWSGAGGSVYLTAGSMLGAGVISANGGAASHDSRGGGGRVSVVLTDATAKVAAFGGSITAYGGVSYVSGAPTTTTDAASGTVYLQDGDVADGWGVVRVVNEKSLYNTGYNDWFTQFGFNGEKELRNATIELGRNARVEIVGDVHVKDITSVDPKAKIVLGGHTLRIHSAKPAWAKDDDPSNDAFVIETKRVIDPIAGTYTAEGQVRWNEAGIAIIVK